MVCNVWKQTIGTLLLLLLLLLFLGLATEEDLPLVRA